MGAGATGVEGVDGVDGVGISTVVGGVAGAISVVVGSTRAGRCMGSPMAAWTVTVLVTLCLAV